MNNGPRTRIFVISLATAPERRRDFSAGAATALEWRFFDARTALDPGLRYDPARARRLGGRTLGAGELGCYASHVALWQQLVDDAGADRYLILEDDVIVDWLFVKELVAATPDSLAGSGLLRLFFTIMRPARRVASLFEQYAIVELNGYASGAAAYLVDKHTAARLAAVARDVILPIDSLMEAGWRHGVPNRAIFPPPVLHPMNETQLGRERFELAEPAPLRLKVVRAGVRLRVGLVRTVWWYRRR